MRDSALTRFWELSILALLGVAAGARALPPMAPYRDQSITMQVPRGWHVQSDAASGTIAAVANPKASDSPAIAIFLRGYSPDIDLNQVADAAIADSGVVRVVERKREGPHALRLLANARKGGSDWRLVLLVGADPARELTVVALFTARPKEFERLGGEALLRAVVASLRSADASAEEPAIAESPAPATPGKNSDEETDEDKLGKLIGEPPRRERLGSPTGPIDRKALVGKWERIGIGAMLDRVDTSSGRVVGQDWSGAGVLLELAPNGQYRRSYVMSVVSGVLTSEDKVSEVGRYTFDGTTLTLRPSEWFRDIYFGHSSNRQQERKRNSPPRSYRVTGWLPGQAVVLFGPCAPYEGCDEKEQVREETYRRSEL